MATVTSEAGRWLRRNSNLARWATSIEVLAIYAGILAYIWRWRHSHHWTWIGLAAVVVASHAIHHDTWKQLGLTVQELRASASVALPLFVILAVPLVVYALLKHTLVPEWPGPRAALYFGGYGVWCVAQQYLAQSYFFNRLDSVLENRHLSAALVALMFGGAHIPNPVLMVVTTCAGFLFSEIFALHRNIWPLALVQTVGGALVGALSPAWLIHNMRVGPGYFFYGIR
ncbi:MAG: hypothetical protein DMG21_21905 [Acidobacteria bacterium]|nr:MAG: hypothetical protein DMG21_21905 [Acidobacteriota bacterium]